MAPAPAPPPADANFPASGPAPCPAPDPGAAPVTHLLYLHGFRSSPRSAKALLVADRVRRRHPGLTWWCPQLPPSPAQAMRMLQEGVAGWPRARMAVIGSSLGGFYACGVARATGCRVVLLNPAVHPARDLARHIGAQTAWHDPAERFFFEPRYVEELQAQEAALGPGPLGAALGGPRRCLAVVAQGDEVLDWREMNARLEGARIDLLPGGDHALSDFGAVHLDRVMAFLGLG